MLRPNDSSYLRLATGSHSFLLFLICNPGDPNEYPELRIIVWELPLKQKSCQSIPNLFFTCTHIPLHSPLCPHNLLLWLIISLSKFSSSSCLCPVYTMTSLTWDHIQLTGGNNYSCNNCPWQAFLKPTGCFFFFTLSQKVSLTSSTIELACDSVAILTAETLRNQAKSPRESVLCVPLQTSHRKSGWSVHYSFIGI